GVRAAASLLVGVRFSFRCAIIASDSSRDLVSAATGHPPRVGGRARIAARPGQTRRCSRRPPPHRFLGVRSSLWRRPLLSFSVRPVEFVRGVIGMTNTTKAVQLPLLGGWARNLAAGAMFVCCVLPFLVAFWFSWSRGISGEPKGDQAIGDILVAVAI